MEDKMDTLDLSIGIRGQKKYDNYSRLDIKARKAKELEDVIQENKEEPIEEDAYFPRATHLAKKLVDTDPGLDFMGPDRREKLIFSRSKSSPTKRN
jgi:hypothetical protein